MSGPVLPVRRIALADGEWREDVWHPAPPPAAAQLFDLAACCARLATVRAAGDGTWLDDPGIPLRMSVEEAVFWLLAMGRRDGQGNLLPAEPVRAAAALAAGIPVALPVEHIGEIARDPHSRLGPAAAPALFRLLTPPEFVALAQEPERQGCLPLAAVIPGIVRRRGRLPLDPAALAELREAVRRSLASAVWPNGQARRDLRTFQLAAGVGLTAEVEALVGSLATSAVGVDRAGSLDVLLGLDRAAVLRHAVRLKLLPTSADQARAWLTVTGCDGITALAEAVQRQQVRARGRELAAVLAMVEAPEAAPHILELRELGLMPGSGREWFVRHPAHALAGLAGLCGGQGWLAEAAGERVRQIQRRAGPELVAAVVEALPEAQSGRLRRQLPGRRDAEQPRVPDAPSWFAAALAAGPRKADRRPPWAEPVDLPPLRCADGPLGDDQVRLLLQALRSPGGDASLPDAVRRHTEPASRDAFAWELFQACRDDDGPQAGARAGAVLRLLGGDGCARRLVPLIRAWVRAGQRKRAIEGLDLLSGIAGDQALIQLDALARSLASQRLRGHAEALLEGAARAGGLSREGLDDRLVPLCDLDLQGRRELVVGRRRLTVTLGPGAVPLLRDADGRVLTSPPRPAAGDDPAEVAAVVADWKRWRKQVVDTVAFQVARLERAMVAERRWDAADFRPTVAGHPLLRRVADRLLWSAHGSDGARHALFRLDEDGAAVDVQGSPADLAGTDRIGVVHPMRLGQRERAAWGQVFADFAIIQPFLQLGRGVHAALPAELAADRFNRFHGLKVPSPTLLFGLQQRGWERGYVATSGGDEKLARDFPTCMSALEFVQDQTHPGRLAIVSCLLSDRAGRPLPLAQADPVVVSEVLNDLLPLLAKAT